MCRGGRQAAEESSFCDVYVSFVFEEFSFDMYWTFVACVRAVSRLWKRRVCVIHVSLFIFLVSFDTCGFLLTCVGCVRAFERLRDSRVFVS